jgi:signal transduction histidine kinase
MTEIKVLIVEDEVIVSMEINDILKELGYTVTGIVSTGREAFHDIEQNRPDLVLMDIKLSYGNMDGIETAKVIRSRYNIPIVYVTAFSDRDTLRRAKVTYPYGFVLKPFKKRELQIAIELALVKHKEETELQESHSKLEMRIIERTTELLRLQERLLHEKRERKLSEQSLSMLEKELSYLSSHLLLVQEHERKKIAHHLRDGIGTMLMTIKEGIEKKIWEIRKDVSLSSVNILSSVVFIIQDAIKDIQKMVIHLNPSEVDNGGLFKNINWLCDEFQKKSSKISVEKNFTIKETEIPENIKTVIYRVTYEAMENIVLHSEAESVHISLRKKDGRLELIIEDNGKGFDIENSAHATLFVKGSGLSTMKELTDMSGGCLIIDSYKDRGTKIKALWYI